MAGNSPLAPVLRKFFSVSNSSSSDLDPHSALDPAIKQKVVSSLEQALSTYVAQVYPGRVAIFHPIENYHGECPPLNREHRTLCSHQFSGDFELHYVPGTDFVDFTAYKEPHVQVLAEKLRACLDRSES
jgi:hypothetical protein